MASASPSSLGACRTPAPTRRRASRCRISSSSTRIPSALGRLAPRYERYLPVLGGDLRRLRFLLERCPVPAGGAVLEIGCGTGRLLRALAGLTPLARMVGVDPEPEMLARAGSLEVHPG